MVRQLRGTVNYVELIGWVGDELEQPQLASGLTMCKFRIATKRLGGRSASGERAIETDWIAIEAWERVAASCLRSLHKGSRVRVIGSLHTQSWEDKTTKQRRYKMVVRADDVMVLDAKTNSHEATHADSEAVEESEETEDIPY